MIDTVDKDGHPDISYHVKKKSRNKDDYEVGTVVAYTTMDSYIGIGFVVKHTPKMMLVVSGFQSYWKTYTSPPSQYEGFTKIHRDPNVCIPAYPQDIEDIKELEMVLKHWNRINNTDIELKFI